MIQELNIKNLAVIEDTTLNFQNEYVALVGETGAGKSLIVDSLSLLAGERTDTSLVRDHEKKASVSAVFQLSEDFQRKHPEVAEYLEGNSLFMRRVIFPDKTSRCYLNDEPVSLTEFRSVTAHLIDIHSQGAKSELLDETKQVNYLDAFGKEKLLKAKIVFQKAYSELEEKKNELKSLIEENKEYDPDYLSFQIKEIKKYDLQEDEIENLNAEYEQSRGFERLKEKYQNFLASVEPNDHGLSDLLGHAITRLSTFQETELSAQAQMAKEKCYEASEALEQLNAAFSAMNTNPKRLDYINQRLFDLKGLQRKYGKTTSEILAKLHDYESKLSFSENFEAKKEDLEIEIKKLQDNVLVKAKQLSEIRLATAKKLDEKIGVEMALLGLRKNAFKTNLIPVELSENGLEHISFEVALNEGLGYAPLAKAASGGESSRLMLALKTVLNALDPYDVLVFDEIDTGVSGKQASLIAHKIQDISTSSQVIVISHLPQVIASSYSAVWIEKITENGVTKTVASELKKDNKKEFIAKMLSGKELTEAALSQAETLMKEFE